MIGYLVDKEGKPLEDYELQPWGGIFREIKDTHPSVTGDPKLLEARLRTLCDHFNFMIDSNRARMKQTVRTYRPIMSNDSYELYLKYGGLEDIAYPPDADAVVAEAFLREVTAIRDIYLDKNEQPPSKDELRKAVRRMGKVVKTLREAQSHYDGFRSLPGGEKLLTELNKRYQESKFPASIYDRFFDIKEMLSFLESFPYEQMIKNYSTPKKTGNDSRSNRIGLVAALANSYYYCFKVKPTTTLTHEGFSKNNLFFHTVNSVYGLCNISKEEDTIASDLKKGITLFKELAD